jgi:hypothetical protein
MADAVSVKKIEQTAAALQECGLATLDDLRTCVSKDVDTGIRCVSINSGISPALLMALLIAEARDDAAKKGTRKLLRYWRSLKTFSAVWSLSTIEIRALWGNKTLGGFLWGRKPVWVVLRQSAVRLKRIWHNRRSHWLDALAVGLVLFLSIGLVFRLSSIAKVSRQYIAAKQDVSLPAFHKIADDVEMKTAVGPKGSFTNIEEVRGRYTLTPIPAGGMLQTAQLLSFDLSKKISGGKLLSVPLKTGSYIATLSAPAEATMVLSPRTLDAKLPASSQTFNVIVLRIENSGDAKSAAVVLPADKFDSAATLLGSHDVFLVQTVP